ncbi:MAG: peptidoglycan-binding protein [Actinobacteria bacterium]|nr:peptidoglycan-binding protein [Actinomycetota bacterium]
MFAFVSSTPLFKTLSVDLSSGSQTANVAALQRALKTRGYYRGSVNGKFGASTETALKKWQADQGVGKTGTLTTTRFVWIPRGSILYSWTVALGSQVSGGAALATVGAPRDLVAQALISQADIVDLKVGQKATLTIDGSIGDAFSGTISSIDTQPASSSSTGGSSSTVQYTVEFAPHGLPTQARSGMTGTLAIILAERQNVLIVPTRAVSGTSTTTYVRVVSDGKPVLRQVTTGMATSTSTEIASGLTAGEVVVTGTITSGASSTGTSTTNGSGMGGLGGFPSGGFPSGDFPAGGPPAGGTQGGGAVPSGGGQ